MYWVNFLHIYQPIDQSKEILKRVVNESYRPLFRGFLLTPGAKINLNINGALTELLIREGYNDVIEDIKKLAQNKKLEFTETAKYHPLLPFLKKEDIVRQVEENRKTNKKYFGDVYQPHCFFPPEMAYSKKVGETVSKMGYRFIILDAISYKGGKEEPSSDKLFIIKNSNNLIPLFRERRVSNCLMSAIIRSKKEFLELVKEDLKEKKYLLTAMDGETFGHHRPGLEKILLKILSGKKVKQIFFSEITNFLETGFEQIEPIPGTWASAAEDVEKGIQFYSWKDPKNKVHNLQWSFLNYLLKLSDKNLSLNIREKVDRAMASDQFFWASGEPWWSIEMIEKGAWTILQTLKSLPGISKKEVEKGRDYYEKIISCAFWWQRSGKIENLARKYKEAVRIPFKERTFEVGGEEVYKKIISLVEKRMFRASRNRNYEKAILWRDAIWKLKTKNDIYDLVHAVNLLRIELPEEFRQIDPKLNELFNKYKEKYDKIKPGQPEKRKA